MSQTLTLTPSDLGLETLLASDIEIAAHANPYTFAPRFTVREVAEYTGTMWYVIDTWADGANAAIREWNDERAAERLADALNATVGA